MSDDGYTIRFDPPAPMRPPSSPADLRAGMVADEVSIAARAGRPLAPRDAERIVDRDLAMLDAVTREAPTAWTPPTPLPVEVAERKAEAVARKREKLAAVQASQPPLVARARKSRILQATSLPTERWSNAKARVVRLLAGVTPHPNPKIAASTCVRPDLAERLIVMQTWIATTQIRRQRGVWGPEPPGERNPFWGVSRKDFGRVLQRMVEDICDASTGVPGLGPWMVPK